MAKISIHLSEASPSTGAQQYFGHPKCLRHRDLSFNFSSAFCYVTKAQEILPLAMRQATATESFVTLSSAVFAKLKSVYPLPKSAYC